ncbi:hypothetical protein HOB10_01680 [Candidatus Parcubacteria bacterium]|jgi:hypothetical protein|nr:hypothetical protein [Candidatus Parcubacteria bacterium]
MKSELPIMPMKQPKLWRRVLFSFVVIMVIVTAYLIPNFLILRLVDESYDQTDAIQILFVVLFSILILFYFFLYTFYLKRDLTQKQKWAPYLANFGLVSTALGFGAMIFFNSMDTLNRASGIFIDIGHSLAAKNSYIGTALLFILTSWLPFLFANKANKNFFSKFVVFGIFGIYSFWIIFRFISHNIS